MNEVWPNMPQVQTKCKQAFRPGSASKH